MKRYQSNVQLATGQGVSTPTVTVRVAATPAGSGALATLYSDNAGTALANPLTGDTRGNFYFFADDGRYDITFSGGTPTITTTTFGDIEVADVTSETSADSNWDVDTMTVTTATVTTLTATTLDAKDQNRILMAHQYSGANAGAKISAAITALPSTGGTVDARGLEGAQTIATDIFTAVTKNVTLLLGAAQFAFSLDTTIPANIALVFGQGGTLEPASSKTLTIVGAIEAPNTQIFAGAGTVSFAGNSKLERVLPQWFGAKGDNVTDDQPAIQKAIDAAETLGHSSIKGAEVYFPTGAYNVLNPIVLPRTGLTPTNVVALRGESERGVRIGKTTATAFPSGRGLIEWDATATQAWHQRIESMTLTLPNVYGVSGIYYTPTWASRNIVIDANITSTDKTLTSATASFSSSDVGKVIFVFGAGADSTVLRSFIHSVTSSTEVELEDAASVTVTNASAMYYKVSDPAMTAVTDGAISANATTLTSPGGGFSAGDVNKPILIINAGEGGLPWATTITVYTDPNTVTVGEAPPNAVSGGLVVLFSANPTIANERFQIKLKDITVETSNQYHFAAAILGGSLVNCQIEHFSMDPGQDTWHQDPIALMFDEIVTGIAGATSYGNDRIGFQFGAIREIFPGVRRGGFGQILRGRLNQVTMDNIRTGLGTKTQPHLELINSAQVQISGVSNEGSGTKAAIKMVACHQMSVRDWSVGSAVDRSYGYGDGVVLMGTTDTLWENGPIRFQGFATNFSAVGKKLISLDSLSARNRFFGVQVNTTFANEISDSGTDNYIEGWEWTGIRAGALKHSGNLYPLKLAVSADNGDNAATLTVGTSATTQRWATALGADRAVTLSTTGAQSGDTFKIVRTATATGAFNLNVGTGPLKALATAGTWCEVQYTGAAWILTAYGAL